MTICGESKGMKTIKVSLIVMISLFLFSSFCLAQANEIDRAKRTLESGIQFYSSGDYRNALQDFQTVITSYSESEWVDEALLRVAIYYYEIEHNLDKAIEQLETITRLHADTNSAPDAYYYLGYFLSDSKTSTEVMRNGLANFERVVRLFPESDKADDALYYASLIHIFFGEFEEALQKLQTVDSYYPDSNLHGEVQFQIGNCYYFMNNITQAMLEYQQVRNRYPDTPVSEKALNRLTLLYRLHYRQNLGKPLFEYDPQFSLKTNIELNDAVYIQGVGDGTFYLAVRGRDRVLHFNGEGVVSNTITIRRPSMVKIAADGSPIILADRKLRTTEALEFSVNSGENSESLSAIEAFCLSPWGGYYIYDENLNDLYEFESTESAGRAFRADNFRDLSDMEIDQFGNLFLLNDRQRKLYKYDKTGRKVLELGPIIDGVELRDPVCLEVDSANNLYLYDRRLYTVFIIGLTGEVISRFELDRRFRGVTSIAIDPSGFMLVLDRGQRRVYRFQ